MFTINLVFSPIRRTASSPRRRRRRPRPPGQFRAREVRVRHSQQHRFVCMCVNDKLPPGSSFPHLLPRRAPSPRLLTVETPLPAPRRALDGSSPAVGTGSFAHRWKNRGGALLSRSMGRSSSRSESSGRQGCAGWCSSTRPRRFRSTRPFKPCAITRSASSER